MAELNFNANDHEPAGEFEPIPAGKYRAAVTESQIKPTKQGNGEYLELTFDILDGDFTGRKVWARLNIKNPSQKAQEIGRGELSSLCRAVGVMHLKRSEELHNIPLIISVKLKRREDNQEMTNEVKGFAAVESARAAAPASAPVDHSRPPYGPQGG